ncbi:MAG: hypothetical protein ACXVHS_09600 [Methanobacterium sp.]
MVTDKKQGGALGKGLDALITKKTVEKSDLGSKTVVDQELEEKFVVGHATDLNDEIVEEILAEIKKNPRISLWSAKSAAVLRYLRKTEPEFSISSEASLLIEQAVKEKYPEIWELFEEHL